MKKQLSFMHLLILAILLTFIPTSTFASHENITVILDGEKIEFDVQPTIINGRTMVPLRAIFEALGAEVTWDDATQTVEADKNNTYIKLSINNSTMYVNSVPKNLDVPATLVNSRTLVPVRAISEAFECDVKWDDATSTVFIYSEDYIDLSKMTNEVETVYIYTAQELIDSIGNNKRLILKSNYYNLSDVKSSNNPFVEKSEYSDGFIIKGVVNLTIIGNAEIAIDDIYADVLDFKKCAYITLDGLTVGHTFSYEQYECEGSVISLDVCQAVTIKNCNLYGCGAVGVSAYKTKTLTVTKSNIYDCSYSGIWFINTESIVEQCNFYDSNYFCGFCRADNSKITLSNCYIYNTIGDYLIDTFDSFDEPSVITVDNCSFESNTFSSLTNQETANLTFKDCYFNKNIGNIQQRNASFENCYFN